jgi:TRAP-type mannitol/chloroaromatic compound transport system permease small subunit
LHALLKLSTGIDKLNRWFAYIASACLLVAVAVSSGNAGLRYSFSLGSNAWLELQWYLFGYIVMFGAAHVLHVNQHVRVDLIYNLLSTRGKIWVDVLGLVFFLLPATLYFLMLCAPAAMEAFRSGEISPNAGGLIRWPAWASLPIGFALVALQGLSELARRVAMLTGHIPAETHYERPLQ